MTTMTKLMRVWRVAEALDCSRREVYQLIQRGELQATRLGIRGIRVAEESLKHYLETHAIVPQQSASHTLART